MRTGGASQAQELNWSALIMIPIRGGTAWVQFTRPASVNSVEVGPRVSLCYSESQVYQVEDTPHNPALPPPSDKSQSLQLIWQLWDSTVGGISCSHVELNEGNRGLCWCILMIYWKRCKMMVWCDYARACRNSTLGPTDCRTNCDKNVLIFYSKTQNFKKYQRTQKYFFTIILF